jgi:organic hydroperoxide reductase OsmC/OhrA
MDRTESVHRARVSWDADSGDARAHTIELAGQRLAATSAVAPGRDPDKADPEAMFVASLSSCHMLWFLALARAEGLRVTSYEDNAEGTLGGSRFTRVTLRPRIAFDGSVKDDLVSSLHHRAHDRCFIANSVNCPVQVEPQP